MYVCLFERVSERKRARREMNTDRERTARDREMNTGRVREKKREQDREIEREMKTGRERWGDERDEDRQRKREPKRDLECVYIHEREEENVSVLENQWIKTYPKWLVAGFISNNKYVLLLQAEAFWMCSKQDSTKVNVVYNS